MNALYNVTAQDNKGRDCPSWMYNELAVSIATIIACAVAEGLCNSQLSAVQHL